MKRAIRAVVRWILAGAAMWGIARACILLGVNRSVAAMALLLGVLGVAAQGDWLLAILSSAVASLAFSYYFVEAVNSFQITTAEGAITFSMMIVTAVTGSHLAIRAQRRAEEAIRRREEMERLQQLGNVLLATSSLAEAADTVVVRIVELFEVRGAALRLQPEGLSFQCGALTPGEGCLIALQPESDRNILELYGPRPSAEVRSALANLIRLVLDRARNAEERARIEAIQRGEELRNTVLNALAHDFRTPLTSIKAAASMLRGSADIPSAHGRELVAVIDEEADRLDQLIRESLDLAKIESHRANPRFEPCLIAEIAGKVTERVGRYLGGRELVVDIAEDLPPIRGDRFLFEQMLMQVVDNAWKYSKPGARIRISARQAGQTAILTVHNQGRQIPDDEGERIFDKFYRGAVSRSQVEGTGLGLAIARAIAEAHGGSVWLDAEPDGPAFRFSLPVGETGRASDRQTHDFAD